MTKNTSRSLLLSVAIVAAVAACGDPLVAPVASTISITAETAVLRPGESTQLDRDRDRGGWHSRARRHGRQIPATMGRVDPEQVETDSGVAKATFTAGGATGTARITAVSGPAEPGVDLPNTFDITIAN